MIKEKLFELKIKLFKPHWAKIDYENRRVLNSDTIHKTNFEKRKALLKHALEHSEFYKGKYGAISVDDTFNEKNFAALPILSRDDIKQNFDTIVTNDINPNKYPKITTSGSTGTSISVLHDRNHSHAPSQWRVLRWWGIAPYENKAFVYRYPKSTLSQILNSLLWWPTKRIFLWAAEMDDLKIKKFIKRYNKSRPAVIQGYNDVVFELALYLLDNDIKIPPPKAVWVTAAPLTSHQRKIMQKAFAAPVYDQYGCSEIPYVAGECEQQNGLHVMEDLVYVECVDENNEILPPNSWGKILLTDLNNYAFPLIRYEIGDYGRLLDSKCSCEINLPLMDNVSGRESDLIATPSNLRLYGNFLTKIFDDYPNSIRSFQIVQLEDFTVELVYVPLNGKNIEKVIKSVVSLLKTKVNDEIPIIPRKVSALEKVDGKTRLIVNHLDHENIAI